MNRIKDITLPTNTQKRKGIKVDTELTVTELVRIQTDTFRQHREGRISGAEAKSILKKVVPSVLKKSQDESTGGFFGGPDENIDIYDVGFNAIEDILSQKGAIDDPEMLASVYAAFVSIADRLPPEVTNPDDKDFKPEIFDKEQKLIATAVTKQYVKFLTGVDFDKNPGVIILPDGREVVTGTGEAAASKRDFERRIFEDDKGVRSSQVFIKGSDVAVSSREALPEQVNFPPRTVPPKSAP